jgi:hypothetical protein
MLHLTALWSKSTLFFYYSKYYFTYSDMRLPVMIVIEVQEDKHSNSGANNGLMSQALQIRFVFASCPLL